MVIVPHPTPKPCRLELTLPARLQPRRGRLESRSAQSAFCSLAEGKLVGGSKRGGEAGDQKLEVYRHCEISPDCARVRTPID